MFIELFTFDYNTREKKSKRLEDKTKIFAVIGDSCLYVQKKNI